MEMKIASKVDFVVMYGSTPYDVSLVEWSAGGWNALLNAKHVTPTGVGDVELEEEFDKSPTVQDILDRIDRHHEARWDEWNEQSL